MANPQSSFSNSLSNPLPVMRSHRKSEFVTDGSKIQRCAAFCFHPTQSLCNGNQQPSESTNGKNATECKAYSVSFFPEIPQSASGGAIIHLLQSSYCHLEDTALFLSAIAPWNVVLAFHNYLSVFRNNHRRQCLICNSTPTKKSCVWNCKLCIAVIRNRKVFHSTIGRIIRIATHIRLILPSDISYLFRRHNHPTGAPPIRHSDKRIPIPRLTSWNGSYINCRGCLTLICFKVPTRFSSWDCTIM